MNCCNIIRNFYFFIIFWCSYGYAEDLDTAAPSLELDNSSQESEESSGTAENEVIEESLEEDTSTVIDNNSAPVFSKSLSSNLSNAPTRSMIYADVCAVFSSLMYSEITILSSLIFYTIIQ